MRRASIFKNRLGGVRYFRIGRTFVDDYAKSNAPKFGFNGLGELVYYRTYARDMDSGHKEQWKDTVERVVNGCFSLQEKYLDHFDQELKQAEAREMFTR